MARCTVPTLRSFFAIYTDGATPEDSVKVPAGTEVFMGEMEALVLPAPGDELFGPYTGLLGQYPVRRGFLLGVSREVRGRAGSFFEDARSVLLESVRGVDGVGLDVLRLWPFPLHGAAELIPDEHLAEDLFSVGITSMGEHGFRAETFGLAKLDQREVSFEFKGEELLEEAGLLCGHLVDWLLEHGRRIEGGHSMAFGFDRLAFFSAEGAHVSGPFRGWHPPLVQRLLPDALFPGVGALEIRGQPEGAPSASEDLTIPLRRSRAQRLVLEELDLTGDSPHASTSALVYGFVDGLANLTATREETAGSRDSGWRFEVNEPDVPRTRAAPGVTTLSDLVRRVPEVVKYLALPAGVRLSWDGAGALVIDSTRVGDGGGDKD